VRQVITCGGDGWQVLDMPVMEWGAALEVPPRLPSRWLGGADGPGVVEPTDLEQACALHLVWHGLARKALLGYSEVALLADCRAVENEAVPVEAERAAARGESLTRWCPGVHWFWPTEQRGGAARTVPA
jgi:hypothetical protein